MGVCPQAGISIGTTTAAQLNDGVTLPCTLDDLHGAATRCWTLGDLIFLAYPGGRHVAIYVGQGLFMDCYNHTTGCVLRQRFCNKLLYYMHRKTPPKYFTSY